jgi:hypothetical protein
MRMLVYLVEHARDVGDGEIDVKTIGIYSSGDKAREAIERTLKLVGFSDFPGGFTADAYMVDEDHWEEGFQTYTPS